MREIWKQKRNIHFTDAAEDSCCIISTPSSPLFFFLPSSLSVGMYYRCAESSLVKAGESLIFLTSLEDNQRM